MSLLKKASIITTPTAYAEDFLYNIKPAGGLGDELVTNGTFDTDSNWNKTGTWTISNNSATADADSTSQYLQQNFTITNGKIYEFNYVILQNTLNGNGAALSSFGGFGTVAISNEIGQHKTFITATNSSAAYVLKIGVSSTCTTGTIIIDNVSVKEVVDFSFDRNSTATRVNEDYLIEDVPYNLVSQSNQFDTTWITASASVTSGQSGIYGTNDAWLLTKTGGFGQISQSLSGISGVNTFSVYIKAGDSNWTRVRVGSAPKNSTYFDLQNGVIGGGGITPINSNIESVGGGWYRCSITTDISASIVYIYPADGDGDVSGTSGSIYIQNSQIVKGDQPKDYLKTTDRLDIPRIDYTNGEPSILLEPSRTNEVTYSQDFTQSYWSKNNVTVTSNQAISPEGIQNADKLIIDNGTVSINGGLIKSRSSTQNQDVSFSIFAKAGEFRYGTIAYGSTNANGFHFDLEDGVILSTFTSTSNYTNIGYEMIPYPNGWYKLVVNTTELVQGLNRYIGIRPHNTIPTSTNNNYSSTGDGTSGIFVYGGQIEVGSYATSLIHTSGSAVTRSEDAGTNAGNSDLINSTEGVLYCEIKGLANDGTFREITLNDDTVNNVVELRYNNVDNQIQFVVRDGGSVTVNSQVVFSNVLEYNKIAFQYKANDFKVFANGRLIATDTAGTVPSGLNQLDFSWAGNNNFYGNAKSVMVFKEALTDLELEKLTGYNNHELYMNYYNRLSYLGLAEEYNVESDINNYIL